MSLTRHAFLKFCLVSILIVLVIAVIFLKLAKHEEEPGIFVEPAFMSAGWGMTQQEVEAANGYPLRPADDHRRFYSPRQNISDVSQYKAMLESEGRSFLGRKAEVVYIFFKDRLFSYHVFVGDRDPVALDLDMRKMLFRKFGQDYLMIDDSQPLKLIWNQKSIIINYWFFKDDLDLGEKYTAGYGVVYRPLEEAISG